MYLCLPRGVFIGFDFFGRKAGPIKSRTKWEKLHVRLLSINIFRFAFKSVLLGKF